MVDDNIDTATILALLVCEFEHDVRTASDGPAALKAAVDYQPDVALLDIGLPGFDGFELAKRIRQQPIPQKMVLVAITGYGTDSIRLRTQEAGFDHYLVKPTNSEKVQEILASVLEKATRSSERNDNLGYYYDLAQNGEEI